ncbi:hypothetical protein [Hylemonella gracilis]|uniref:hypothetical protein n=1 Tax=Hylemonella gracilis TaxID=80880 RepID=UPI0010387CBE|nr:hypothetical protein [Hylemonella gracilis]
MTLNLNSDNNLPRILAFPKGQDLWRIDWFGDIAFPDRSQRRKQPSVFLNLSKLSQSRFQFGPTGTLPSNTVALAQRQRRVWVSVGTLPLLRIGDIWRDGQPHSQPDYELEEFKNLQITSSTVSLVKAGLNLNEQGFLLPVSEHPWHMQCTQSYCVVVALPDGRRLVIPCMELIRFYFGSSSGLVSRLFSPPLQRESLYSRAEHDLAAGHIVLHLAERLSGASAADIARIHLDSRAWRAAALVGTSLLRASTSQQAIYPQAVFPFEGETDLQASGQWLSFGDQPRASFLVYSLRSCSHPFPFQSLQYEVPLRHGAPDATNSGSKPKPASAPEGKDQSLIERDASNRLTPKTRRFQGDQRFPDLIPKSIWRRASISPEEFIQSRKRYLAKQAIAAAAVGDPGSEQRIRSVEFATAIQSAGPDLMSAPEFLRPVLLNLLQATDAKIELLTCSDHDGWTIPIPLVVDEDGEIDQRLFTPDADSRTRLRRVAAFEIRRHDQLERLIAIEDGLAHQAVASNTSAPLPEILRRAAMDYCALRVEQVGEADS